MTRIHTALFLTVSLAGCTAKKVETKTISDKTKVPVAKETPKKNAKISMTPAEIPWGKPMKKAPDGLKAYPLLGVPSQRGFYSHRKISTGSKIASPHSSG